MQLSYNPNLYQNCGCELLKKTNIFQQKLILSSIIEKEKNIHIHKLQKKKLPQKHNCCSLIQKRDNSFKIWIFVVFHMLDSLIMTE